MKETTNYSLFKHHKSNRPIDPKNVDKLVSSLEKRNLLEFRPILVNSSMEVIDGQHRLEAAKQLGLSVYYQINDEQSFEAEAADILLLNTTQKLWTLTDYLNYHASIGNQNYIKAQQFCRAKSLSPTNFLSLLGGSSKESSTTFKMGKFVFPSGDDLLEMETKYEQLRMVVDYLTLKTIGSKAYLNGPKFTRALSIFFNLKSVEFEVFFAKLPMRMTLLRSCTKLLDFLQIFKEIYNYKNRNPISFDRADPTLPNEFIDTRPPLSQNSQSTSPSW